MKNKNTIIITLIIIAIILISYWCLNKNKQITNFEECIAAGNPAMESYPRQCRDPKTDKTFTEEISDAWRIDGIHLMQHETEGAFGTAGSLADLRRASQASTNRL